MDDRHHKHLKDRCYPYGALSPVRATDDMTEPVGVRDQQLWTAPSDERIKDGIWIKLTDDGYTWTGVDYDDIRVGIRVCTTSAELSNTRLGRIAVAAINWGDRIELTYIDGSTITGVEKAALHVLRIYPDGTARKYDGLVNLAEDA